MSSHSKPLPLLLSSFCSRTGGGGGGGDSYFSLLEIWVVTEIYICQVLLYLLWYKLSGWVLWEKKNGKDIIYLIVLRSQLCSIPITLWSWWRPILRLDKVQYWYCQISHRTVFRCNVKMINAVALSEMLT